MKHRSSRSKSKTKNYYQSQRKSSLASLMEHYNPDDVYSVKLNMNSHVPQIIQTKAYNFSSKRNQEIKCNRSKSPKQNTYFNGMSKRLQSQNNSKYQSPFSSNKVTPTKIRNNSLFGRDQSYFNSNRGSNDTSRQGYGLFRQIIKKQSKQNSICHNSQYYDLIQKKANQIKQEKKKLLERCHSNGTLSNVLQTMKLNAHNEIEQYARSIFGVKDSQSIQKQNQTQSQTSQSKISQVVGNSNKQNSSIYNNQFSFQMDNFQEDKQTQNNVFLSKQSHDQYNIFNIKPLAQKNLQKENINLNIRPFSKISHSNQNNNNIQTKNQKFQQNKRNIITSNEFSKIQIPQQLFVNPKDATIYAHVQLKHLEPIKTVTTTFVEMDFTPKTDQWIRMKRPDNLNYLSQAIEELTTSPKDQDFLKTNDFTYPFRQHAKYI